MHKFTSTKPSSRCKFSGVRVYSAEGLLLVEYPLNQYNPIGYLRKRNGKHRKAFVEQCIAAGIPQNEIDEAMKK